ncbi:MAG: S8 family serine peptidase [Crocinitomicaceae bacterium]|nr:S8 family serine peptidase [Crocinitomicaceae bacterium]
MKTKFLFFITLVLFLAPNLKGQNVYYDFQDGLVIFQLKESRKIILSSDKMVDYRKEPLFDVLEGISIIEVKQLHPDIKDEKLRRTYQIQLNNPNEVDEVVRRMAAHDDVQYAELKELHRKLVTPNDPIYGSANSQMWGLFKVNASQAWGLTTGDANIKVAVTDDAVNTNHPDLVNKMLPGRNTAENNNNPNPCGGNNGNHGTHVAGTVGAETNNGIGVASIGWNVSIIPVAIGRCSDGALTAGYDGIIWSADQGADVINMSWGGGGGGTYGQNVCNYAWNQGAILIAAAGNSNSNQQFFPAAFNNVVAVAATQPSDARASFSQYGTWIDIAAPGTQIQSTSTATTSGYQSLQGTSMASPLVSGFMGLMKSFAPNATNTDLINCMYSTADNIDAQNPNFIGQLGAGRLNAYAALQCAQQFASSYDAAIIQINSPKSTICGTSFTPEVVLRNFGGVTLTSVTINYDWNGTQMQHQWTGSLPTGQTETVTLPSQTGSNGTYTFTAATSMPNGVADENPSNDASSLSFTIDENGQFVELTLELDCFADEISWEIEDDFGAIVASGGGYTNNVNGQTIIESLCLPQGCYFFKIYDTYGDGMNGSQWQSCSIDGDYEILDQSGNVLVEMTAPNADFGFEATHPFCIVGANIQNDAGISQIVAPQLVSCGNTITPTVRLRNFGGNNLTSVTINYNAGSGAQSFNWTGNLATGQTEDITLPSVNAANGPVTITATTNNPNGTVDDNPANNTSTRSVNVHQSAMLLPFEETFETAPLSSGRWTVDNPDNSVTWETATVGGNTPGNTAMKLDFFDYAQTGERDALISPTISLNGYTSAEMTFEHAYRRFDQTAADSLVIYVSTDCGQTFTRVFGTAEDGTGSFATAVTSTVAFTPAQASDWCFGGTVGADCFTVDLTPFVENDILVKFESFNGGTIGNNLYIDNINIDGVPNNNPPTPNYSASNTTICEGGSVTFTDQSTAGITSRLWTFQGGTPATSTAANPTVTYANAGNYNVTLEVTNANGTESITNQGAITVNNPPATPSITQNGNVLSVNLAPGESADWYFNGDYIGSGASITITQSGNYYVVVNNGPNCESASEEREYQAQTSVEELVNNTNVVLFPNPTNGKFEVNMSGVEEPFEVTIVDALGRVVVQPETFAASPELTIQYDLSQFGDGMYIVIFNANSGRFTKKVTLRK